MYKLSEISKSQYAEFVGLLTIDEKDLLIGQEYLPFAYFNPIQDADGDWVISVEEMEQCDNDKFMWVKDLPLIPYNPIQ